MGTNLHEVSIGRDFRGSEGVSAFTTGNPFRGTNLLEVSIGRGLAGSTAFTTENPLRGTNLLEFSIGRELGALKGSTPSLLETLFGRHIYSKFV